LRSRWPASSLRRACLVVADTGQNADILGATVGTIVIYILALADRT
jgi:hypothetical protein